MATEDYLSKIERYVNPGLARVYRFMGLVHTEMGGQGAEIFDEEGTRYLDFAGGYGVFIHGYNHPRIVAAARRQLDALSMSSRILPNPRMADLAELLASVTPGDLEMSFFSNSGAEAVEASLKFARLSTGRSRIVATIGAFHGKTMGALSVSGRDTYQTPFRPLVPDIVHVPYGDAEAAAAAIDDQTAAVLVEPIQGEGGVIVPPEGYLRELRRATERYGALLIVDEVQTGMGRTGRLWAVEHEDIVPDLLVAAKALGGGIVPIGATIGRPDVMRFFADMPLIHTSTFGGGPLACAVASEAIHVALDEDLPGQAARKGAWLLPRLQQLAEAYPDVLHEARGRGLMIGLEMTSEGAGGALMAELVQRRMLAVYTLNNARVIRMIPPLVITDAQLEDGFNRLSDAVAAVHTIAAEL